MDILTIVRLSSYAIALLIFISFPIRFSLFSKIVGTRLTVLASTKANLYIVVIALSIIMLIVLYFRDFSLVVSVVLHGTALLAIEMGVREFLNRIKSGVYEYALVCDGRIIRKDEIFTLPTLEYEKEADNTLDIVTEKRGTIKVFFSSVQERMDALTIIKEWQKK